MNKTFYLFDIVSAIQLADPNRRTGSDHNGMACRFENGVQGSTHESVIEFFVPIIMAPPHLSRQQLKN